MSIAFIDDNGVVAQVDRSTNIPPPGWVIVDDSVVCGMAKTGDGYMSSISLSIVAERKIAEINAACRASIEAGFTSVALGAPHLYPAKEHDQINLIGQHARAQLSGQARVFWCVDETGVAAYLSHTAAQLARVIQDGGDHKEAQLMRGGALKRQVEDVVKQGGTTAEIDTIVW